MTSHQHNEHSRDVHPHHVGARPLAERIAVSPVPGGPLDSAAGLARLGELGVAATELGPPGFLPEDPQEAARLLADAGLEAAGQVVPVVLDDPAADPLAELEPTLDRLTATEASTLVVVAPRSGDPASSRDDDGARETLLRNVDRVAEAAEARGLTAALCPRVGTAVEPGDDTQRVLDGSRIGLCLDTGAVLEAGGDPVALARRHARRIAHVHLRGVASGDLDVAGLVSALEDAGYDGWYVLQDDEVEEALDHLLALAAQWSGVGT
ncbi:sugar phosphate isomerase/epimerase [Intrasporangium calvum]|uniref:Sugar phosphate isomerase/epimerase n=1 Tax=Intrasporangium calvum TaxID=53358 RepID=A0ABT5GEI9_9MICO|nr:sugar phosphate isomerase/epimerase [Intrasporangium calvum]MDC5696672.1 sugar phosphate isomerase/epimerase [Intrasporangium calvum]